jgi:serine protease Do
MQMSSSERTNTNRCRQPQTGWNTPRIRLAPLVGQFVALFLAFSPPLPAQDALHQFSNAVEELARRVAPSVVQVVVTGYAPLDDARGGEAGVVLGRQRSIGSGVIVDPDGYIVTNAHVVRDAQRVQVLIPSPVSDTTPIRSLTSRGRTLDARIVGLAEEIDLAVLHVEAHGLPALPIGNYERVRQGEMVFAFGNPEGLRNSVTMGLVSSVARQPDPDSPMVFVQTDAPINPGNSGGPLVDVDGALVGINTFILTQSGGNEGLGFAIPSSVVAFAYPQLRKYGHVHRGEIGVVVQTITLTLAAGLGLPRDSGVIVSDVLPGSPAEKSGLKIGDIVLTVDGRPSDSLPLFTYGLFIHGPGEHVKLGVMRGKERLAFDIPVSERKHDVDRLVDMADPGKNMVQRIGILGVEIDSKIAAMLPDLRVPSGVIVAARAAGPAGAVNSLLTGDVIHALNGSPITSLLGLRSGLENLKPESSVVLQLERGGGLMFVSFQLE